ncbi:hypothetical protein D3C78_1822860 [compost metagenome]
MVELKKWIENKRNNGCREVGKNEILQRGPCRVRKKDRLNAAIATLCDEGEISTYICNRVEFVKLQAYRRRPESFLQSKNGMLTSTPINL